jgi:hypothetical protein
MRRPRAASCMRLLDQTRQQCLKTLLWCKGRPSARPPRRPSANLCDRSDSGFFALEGNPHQRCLARIEHPRRAKGLGDGRPADDSRPQTKSPRLAPAAPPSGARCRRLPLASATPLPSNGGCDATGAAGASEPERHSPANDVQRADRENRTPTPQPDFSETREMLRFCLTACASADARREPNVHRPAARREATETDSKLGWPPARSGRGPEAAGGQLHALVRPDPATTPEPAALVQRTTPCDDPRHPAATPCDRSGSGFLALEGNPHQRRLARTMRSREAEGLGDRRPTDDSPREARAHDWLRRRHPAALAAADFRSEVPRHLRATAAATQRAPPAAANRNATPRPTTCSARIARTELPLRNQTFQKPERCIGSV